MNDQSQPDASATPLPEITGYRLLRVLGRGGMSTVYLALQTSLNREVAVKVMLPEALADEVSRRRFENEARTIARLEHPHIVGIHDVGRTQAGLPYYAMPHLPRGHLGQRLVDASGATMELARVREILRALLSALGYAHARGTIHRDVKAENVLFDETGRPLLADFGIALRRGHGTRVTTAGLAVGSTAYMPPEQARGEDVDPRADLYSVGVLAWEMLTGELPYNSSDALSMAVMHIKDPIPKLPGRLRNWQRFVERALAKSPGKRYRDAAQMLEALEAIPQRGGTRQFAALTALRGSANRIRTLPRFAWVIVVLAGAAAIGIGLNRGGDGGSDGFFRASPSASAPAAGASGNSNDSASGLPAPGAAAGQPVVTGDPGNAMLRAAPSSAAEHGVAEADAYIRQRRLLTPASGNAYQSLLGAFDADPGYLGLPAAIGRLVDALGRDAVARLGVDDAAGTRDSLQAARALAAKTGQSGNPAIARMDAMVTQVLRARIDASARHYDRAGAEGVVDTARSAGLTPSSLATLAARVERIPRPGTRIDGLPGDMLLAGSGDAVLAAALHPVTRDDYARFAQATGRPEARCRERASLLRLVAPRSWQSPGFKQSGSQAVVCVSPADAEGYARWLGDRDGQRYRLPRASEAGTLPSDSSSRRVSLWTSDCKGNCEDARVASGASWRGDSGARPMEGDRGYDDVGIRLVSDL